MRSILTFYCYCFFHCFAPITLFYGLMMSQQDLDAFAIAQIIVCGALTGFVLELPSGALADRYGIKYALIFAQILRACAFCLLLVNPSWGVFAFVFMLLAFKESLISGSTEALLVSYVRDYNLPGGLARYLGYTTSVKRFALLLSGFTGTLLLHYGWPALLLCSLLSAILGIYCACLLRSPDQFDLKSSVHSRSPLQTIVYGKKVISAHPLLRWHILYGGITGGLIACLWQYWSIIGSDLALEPHLIGLFVIGINVSGLLAGLISSRIEQCSVQDSLYLWYINAGILFVSFSCYNFWSVSGFLLFMAIFYTLDIIHTARYQVFIPDGYRATVVSYEGCLFYGVELPGSLLFGILAQTCGYQNAGIVLAITLCCIVTYFQYWHIALTRNSRDQDITLLLSES